jgi:5-methylcytosine-specific restriction endonuclease McrA
MLKAAVKDGKIYVWTSKFAPWETPDKEYRKTKAYREWRNQVFERDKHTCRNCGTTDNLQAHHIKPFAKYVKLRFKLSNGLTLCEKCHREVHKKNPKKVSG